MERVISKRSAALSFLLLTALFCGGCAGLMTKPFPIAEGPLNLGVIGEKPAYMFDWPPGAYEIPNTNVFVSTVQGGDSSIAAGILFGFIGMEINGGNIAMETKKKIQDYEKILGVDLVPVFGDCLRKEMARYQGTSRVFFPDKMQLVRLYVFPYLVFNYIDEARSQLWTVLKLVLLKENTRKPEAEWACRYITGLGGARPMTGPGGWTDGQGELLKQAVINDMKIGSWMMLRDIHGKLRNETAPKVKMKGRWVFYSSPREADVKVLERNAKFDVVLPQVEDEEFFAGINILPKDFAESVTPVKPGEDPHAGSPWD